MTALQEQAVRLIEGMPDERLPRAIALLRDLGNDNQPKRPKEDEEALARSRAAYQNLQKYRRVGTVDIDYKEELATALEEKYASLS